MSLAEKFTSPCAYSLSPCTDDEGVKLIWIPFKASACAAHCRRAGDAKLEPVPLIGTGATAEATWDGSGTARALTRIRSALNPEMPTLRTHRARRVGQVSIGLAKLSIDVVMRPRVR